MGKAIHTLTQQLTGKTNLEECSLEEVKRLAQRHPYYAPAQFLLLQKLRQCGPPEEAEAQYKKAVLFYPDPVQFELFIASGKFYAVEKAEAKSAVDEIGDADANETMQPFVTKVAAYESHQENFRTLVTKPIDANPPIVAEEVSEFSAQPPVHEADAIAAEEAADYGAKDSPPALDKALPETEEKAIEPEATPPVDATYFENQIQPPLEDIATAPPTEEAVAEEVIAIDAVEPNREDDAINTQNEPPDVKATLPSPVETPLAHINHQNTQEQLAFEPYHTVDYFASQGIKITADEVPKDKLGKGLKSFTEWLRTMKRLPQAEAVTAVESNAEKKVESMADRSLDGSEVMTEAMADVWLKQGNTQKALDIYNKLSLLNPSKTAYFAAKIENVKPL